MTRTGTVRYATVDEYLATLEAQKRSTLQTLRETIRSVVPDAEECISYAMPAFRMQGKVVAGFAAFENHLSYVPHSGSVIPALRDKLAGYDSTDGSLHFPVDKPLPKSLVAQFIAIRLTQLGIEPGASTRAKDAAGAGRRRPAR